MAEIETWSYIGRAACGCLRAAVVDDPDMRQMVARETARMIRGGLAVERVTCDYVRTTAWNCDEHKRKSA